MRNKRFLLAPVILAAITGFSFITMLLWNALIPEIFHLSQISFWQAAGMLILSRLLLGFSPPWMGFHNHRGHQMRERWEHMSPEEREEFKKHLHQYKYCWTEPKDKNPKQETFEDNKL
jgi:hypothetical protein